MPKIKAPKGSPSIDMTPMVDLAFLLVTFFMLSASFRSSEPVDVDVPTSISDKIIPENVSVELETNSDVEKSLLKILRMWGEVSEVVPLGDRWKGGTMLLQPADKTQKPKEVPVDIFFHKIVMLRDRLRVMEQQINAHKILSDEEKVNLQQYITRIYGTLTTFNVLFKNKEQWFVGEKGSAE